MCRLHSLKWKFIFQCQISKWLIKLGTKVILAIIHSQAKMVNHDITKILTAKDIIRTRNLKTLLTSETKINEQTNKQAVRKVQCICLAFFEDSYPELFEDKKIKFFYRNKILRAFLRMRLKNCRIYSGYQNLSFNF